MTQLVAAVANCYLVKEGSVIVADYLNNRRETVCGGLCLAAGVYIAGKYVLPDLKRRCFATFFSALIKKENPEMEAIKAQLFEPMKSIKSIDKQLQEKNAIRILEIGVGSGTNFRHYFDGCHLIVVDPNPHFKKYYDANRNSFQNIRSEEIIVAAGEDLHMVPTGSVDAVVMTLVLCSVNDATKIMKEVRRVLAPGGKFFFLEHVQEWDLKSRWKRQYFQTIFTASGIWPFFLDGCQLNRNPIPYINAAGFTSLDFKYINGPFPWFLHLARPQVYGVATK